MDDLRAVRDLELMTVVVVEGVGLNSPLLVSGDEWCEVGEEAAKS